MILELKKALAPILLEIDPEANVYTKESKQFTELPAFFITRVDSQSSGGYMKPQHMHTFNITYIQNKFDEAKMDEVEYKLLNLEEISSCRLLNKMSYQVDDDLHFQFDVRYFWKDSDQEGDGEIIEHVEFTEDIKNV